MPVPITTGNWGKLLDRLLTEIFHDNLIKTPQMYTQVYNVGTSSKASERHLTGVGLEDWRESGEGVAANFTENIQGFDKQYVPTIWKSGFAVTREMIDDDLFDVVANDAKKLSTTAIRTIDKEGAKLINNATNTTFFSGADGLSLANDSHLREDSGTVLDNAGTGVLNETNLEIALVAFQERQDGRGELVDLTPDTLLVPPSLEKEGLILMRSTGRVSTANNDINVYNGRLNVMVWKRIGAIGGGSDTAWLILDSSFNKSGEGLNIFMRINPEISMETEVETSVRKWVGYMRFSQAFTSWRGVQHQTGTA